MDFREWEQAVADETKKHSDLQRTIEQKESAGTCACQEHLEISKMYNLHILECKTCFKKNHIVDESALHSEAAFLMKSWIEDSVHPGP